MKTKESFTKKAFIITAFAACLTVILFFVFVRATDTSNKISSFSEKTVFVENGWTLTDSSGNSKELLFPYTLDYGTDGVYTLSCCTPKIPDIISSPTFVFYSNYVDFAIYCDNQLLGKYPYEQPKYSPGTGNIWYMVRLPDASPHEIRIDIKCQLGDNITYLLEAPEIGSKATILNRSVLKSFPVILICGAMAALSVTLFFLYLILRKKLGLDFTTVYLAIFIDIFVVYIFLETPYAKLALPNPYMVYSLTLMLISLLPVPLIGAFFNNAERKYIPVIYAAEGLCITNFFVQFVLHVTGIINYRVVLPITHAVIILSVIPAILVLFLTSKKEHPGKRIKLLTALPMFVGGCIDIALIWLRHPSLNNNLFFIIGVSVFFLFQFISFIRLFFEKYHEVVEKDVLLNMAYSDELTGLENRNAYELKLQALKNEKLPEKLGCIVADINRLKFINDTFGHIAGDKAISETGRLIREICPDNACCYRTGGDEFIILIENISDTDISKLSCKLQKAVEHAGNKISIPVTLSVGGSSYKKTDTDIINFIKRVDAVMYEDKQRFRMVYR